MSTNHTAAMVGMWESIWNDMSVLCCKIGLLSRQLLEWMRKTMKTSVRIAAFRSNVSWFPWKRIRRLITMLTFAMDLCQSQTFLTEEFPFYRVLRTKCEQQCARILAKFICTPVVRYRAGAWDLLASISRPLQRGVRRGLCQQWRAKYGTASQTRGNGKNKGK